MQPKGPRADPALQQVRGERRDDHAGSPRTQRYWQPLPRGGGQTPPPTVRGVGWGVGGRKDNAPQRNAASFLLSELLARSNFKPRRCADAMRGPHSAPWSSSWEMMVIRFWRPKMKPLSWPSCTTLSSP